MYNQKKIALVAVYNCLIGYIPSIVDFLLDMDSTPADSRKPSRRRHPKSSKKSDGSCASQASSSSAGSSLASSRVSTPSLATNAFSASANLVAPSSSNTSATSDLRLKIHYDRVSVHILVLCGGNKLTGYALITPWHTCLGYLAEHLHLHCIVWLLS